MSWFGNQDLDLVMTTSDDDNVHTINNPYCGDPTCEFCHTDLDHHRHVQNVLEQDHRPLESAAFSFFGISR